MLLATTREIRIDLFVSYRGPKATLLELLLLLGLGHVRRHSRLLIADHVIAVSGNELLLRTGSPLLLGTWLGLSGGGQWVSYIWHICVVFHE